MDITKSLTVYETVSKLIGPVVPVGETNADDRRFDNLREMCALVEMLVSDIEDVSINASRHESSMKRAGEYALSVLREMREELPAASA
jgi:hypothetical protein